MPAVARKEAAVRSSSPLPKLLLFAAGVCACVVGYLFLFSLLARGVRETPGGALAALFLAASTLLLNRWFLRSEGRSPAEIGLDQPRRRARQAGLGFLGGCALALGWLLIVTLALRPHWRAFGGFSGGGAAALLAFLLCNNAGEEMVYRGYAFLRLQEAYGPGVATVVTSAVFALLHVQGGVPWPSALAGVFTSGLVFGVLFARWRSLPLVLGFHVATNVLQEVAGLRRSPLSLLEPVYPASAAGARGLVSLALVAALNLAVALWLARGALREGRR